MGSAVVLTVSSQRDPVSFLAELSVAEVPFSRFLSRLSQPEWGPDAYN